jgi:beta-glucosidase-like glycosyl hydrolase
MFLGERPITPIIMTIKGTKLNTKEKLFIVKNNPFGYLIHIYNVTSKDQAKKLLDDIKRISKRDNIFFLIDQEGGRVDRLLHITGKKTFPQFHFGEIAKTDLDRAKKETYNQALNNAKILSEIGVNLNLSPVLDVLRPDSNIKDSYDNISSTHTKEDIGDRSFSKDPNVVSVLGEQVISAMNEKNIYSCIKHLPGLGGSRVNSHHELPVINKSMKQLEKDLIPFKKLNYVDFAMIGHAMFPAIDKENISTFSKKLITLIRKEIGFKGLIISDALNMKALGDISDKEKVHKALDAGVDIVMPFFIPDRIDELDEIVNSISQKTIIDFNKKFSKKFNSFK